ncbi:MAG: outer membrane beta-barrel protein [Burkholderiales bacterium]|nr:outer membrane beta-barrel protein [Burkholderiales bacterium]
MEKTLLLCLLGVLTISLANADSANGAYINANAGYGSLQNLPTGSFALGINAGYNFNRAFALEAGWTNLSSNQYGVTSYDNYYDVAVKGTLPLSDIFSLYGRLGGGINTTGFSGTASVPNNCALCTSGSNYAWLAGLGASFALSQHFDLRIEDYMILPMGGGNLGYGNINNITGGVQYNF